MPDLAWWVIAGGLSASLIGLSLFMEWLERRYVRRETVRREIVSRAHVHQFVLLPEPVDGVYLERCFCDLTRPVREEEAQRVG